MSVQEDQCFSKQLVQVRNLPDTLKRSVNIQCYKDYERSIRKDLSEGENELLKNIQSILSALESSKCTVFASGSYPAFLEGLISGYTSLRIFITSNSEFSSGYIENRLKECMTNISTIDQQTDRKVFLFPNLTLIFFWYTISFTNGKKIAIQFTIAMDLHYQIDNRAGNILRLLMRISNSIYQTALPAKSKTIFRTNPCRAGDALRMEADEDVKLTCYGKPFSLIWHCAKYFKIIPHGCK